MRNERHHIDPAPSKPTVAFDGARLQVLEPIDVRPWLESRLASQPDTLVAWDAPLAFDPNHSFYTRPVDKHLAAAATDEPAVNTAHFGNLSHWSITCHVLGYPFGDPPQGLQIVDAMPASSSSPVAIEVHPAFAAYQWWRSAGRADVVPAYKRGGRRQRLAAVQELLHALAVELRCERKLLLALEARQARPDDLLDAVMAWEVGKRFVEGTTTTVGDAKAGFIVLPGPVE